MSIKTYTQSDLAAILAAHGNWRRGEDGGKRADLQDADLRDADLRDADLRGADLQGANLQGADLQRAYLRGADLRGADLQRANLQRADLRGADLRGADLPSFQVCPQEGEFIAWKKLRGNIVTRILIPAEAKRTSSLIGRKCRAEFAVPLDAGGKSLRDDQFLYVKDEIARCDEYDPDVRIECSGGIHFFMTKEEAETWQ